MDTSLTSPSLVDAPILVIEDDPEVRLLLELLLQDEGWMTQAASSGEAGLALARVNQPSLVVLDFGLPGVNGETVAAQMRALYHDIPILLITADGREEEHARRAQAYAYLPKPFDLRAIIDTISRGLSRNRDIDCASYGGAAGG